MKAVKILVALCIVLFLNGFSNVNVFAQDTKPGDKNENAQPAKKDQTIQDDKTAAPVNKDGNVNPANQTALQQGRTNEKYRIGFQDTLDVQVFRHPELSQVVNVSPDGTILMPRIDQPIVAVCKTERELSDTVATLYKNYLRNPFVNVRAVDQRSQPFAVIGAVEKPGSFYLNRKIRLLELLAFAGGPKVEKSGSKIQIARVGNVSGCTDANDKSEQSDQVQFIGYRLNDVMDGKQNPWMEPGDIVSVLEAEEAFVVGKVFKPAKVSLKEPLTLTQAIASAGGLDPTANTDRVVIQRQEQGSAVKTELVYNLKDIKDKKVPDPFLQANDIVEVSNDKGKSVRNGLLKALTGGLPNLFYRVPLP